MANSSGLFNLDLKDFGKGLLMAVLGAVAAVVQDSINQGKLSLDWKYIGGVALLAGVGYITKNLLTNNKDQFLSKDK